METKKYVYLFSEGNAKMREILGGKGANLAEMTNLHLPVPQGFTISTEACTQYYEDGKKINKEIYAWINIPGTVIDYPILRSAADNAYYLNHTAEGKSSAYGAIYTEDYNDTDFADFNTVIYGHNMKNGTMFGSLRKFRNKEFFNSNREINIYMPGRIMKYRIFAAHTTDDRHILLSYDFKNRDVCSQYLESIFSSKGMTSYFDKDIPVTADDRIITLSTCTGKDDERYLIQGVLTYDSRKQAS